MITEGEETELNVETGEEGEEINVATEAEEGENRVMDEQLERIANPYFLAKEHMTLNVRANYYMGQEPIDEIVDAEIDRLRVYEKGAYINWKSIYPQTQHRLISRLWSDTSM